MKKYLIKNHIAILAIVMVIALAVLVLSVSVVSGAVDPNTVPEHTHTTAPSHSHFHTHSAIPHEHDEHEHDSDAHQHGEYVHQDDGNAHDHGSDYLGFTNANNEHYTHLYTNVIELAADDPRQVFTSVYDCELHGYLHSSRTVLTCTDPTNPNFEISVTSWSQFNTSRLPCHLYEGRPITGDPALLANELILFTGLNGTPQASYAIHTYGYPVLHLEALSVYDVFRKLVSDVSLTAYPDGFFQYDIWDCLESNGSWRTDVVETIDMSAPDIQADLTDNNASADFSLDNPLEQTTNWLYRIAPLTQSCTDISVDAVNGLDYDEYGFAYTSGDLIALDAQYDGQRVCFRAERGYTGILTTAASPVYNHIQ